MDNTQPNAGLTDEGGANGTPSTDGSKTYTEEELLALLEGSEAGQKILQSTGDKARTKAWEEAKKKYERQLTLSQMDEQARAAAEKDDLIAQLQEQIRQNTIKEQTNEVMKTLSAHNLPSSLADVLLITDNKDDNLARITLLSKEFKKALQAEIARIGGKTPPAGSEPKGPVTKAEFNSWGLAKQQQWVNDNPDWVKHNL